MNVHASAGAGKKMLISFNITKVLASVDTVERVRNLAMSRSSCALGVAKRRHRRGMD